MDEIQQCVDDFLTGKIFNENEADQLINDILEKVMEILYRFKKPFKYMADLMLSHRVGACMTNYTSAYFDKSLDNIYYIFYPKEKNAGGKAQIFTKNAYFTSRVRRISINILQSKSSK